MSNPVYGSSMYGNRSSMTQSDAQIITALRFELEDHCRRINAVQALLDQARSLNRASPPRIHADALQNALNTPPPIRLEAPSP